MDLCLEKGKHTLSLWREILYVFFCIHKSYDASLSWTQPKAEGINLFWVFVVFTTGRDCECKVYLLLAMSSFHFLRNVIMIASFRAVKTLCG